MTKNTVKLEDIANIDYGTRVVKSKVEGDEYPVYGGGGETFRINKFNRENCVVISRFAMSPRCTRYVNEKIFLNDSGLTVSTKDENILLQEYLDWYLLSKNDEIYSLGRGAGQRNLEIPSFKRMLIPYPTDLEEQRKIISQLKLADKIRVKKKLANDKLDEFLKSTYIDLFAENTKKVKLEELCYFITKGTTPKAQDMSQDSGDIPYIKVYNLRFDTRLDFTINPTFVTKESHKNFLARSVVYPGDVLMNIVGPPLCKVSIVPDTYPEWNINQAIARFRCNKGLNNLYLAWFLTTPFAEKQMLRNAKKTSGQLNLTLEICKNIEIPLPSLDLQNKFAKIVEKVEAQKQKNELVLEQMNNLFNSLSQKAFKNSANF